MKSQVQMRRSKQVRMQTFDLSVYNMRNIQSWIPFLLRRPVQYLPLPLGVTLFITWSCGLANTSPWSNDIPSGSVISCIITCGACFPVLVSPPSLRSNRDCGKPLTLPPSAKTVITWGLPFMSVAVTLISLRPPTSSTIGTSSPASWIQNYKLSFY